ncbi:MAG: serine hydrolase [Flavobacterium sp.]
MLIFSTKWKNTSDSSFPITSITKTFTSTAILQLVEKEQLKLEI